MDTFSADTEQRGMLSPRLGIQGLALSLFASELVGAGPMLTNKGPEAKCPEASRKGSLRGV